MSDGVLLWAFLQNYHADKMNAAIHCAPVKFSPLTFRLSDALFESWPDDEDITVEMHEIRSHQGQYELDGGR
jgi:hypothetical protein